MLLNQFDLICSFFGLRIMVINLEQKKIHFDLSF